MARGLQGSSKKKKKNYDKYLKNSTTESEENIKKQGIIRKLSKKV